MASVQMETREFSCFFVSSCVNQAKRKERMVKERLQKQMMSVAEQQQRLNKVRMELEKLETVRFRQECFQCLKVSFRHFQPIRRDVDEIRSRVEVGMLCHLRSLSTDSFLGSRS